MSWRRLSEEAPELEQLARARIESTRVLLLGTLRRDGSPRISPVEPYLSGSQLLIGAMSWSTKVADLARDPRCVLHGTVSGPSTGEPELKLYGSAVDADPGARTACTAGWWQDAPADAARVYAIELGEVILVEWDYDGGQMTVRRWTPGSAPTTARRRYP